MIYEIIYYSYIRKGSCGILSCDEIEANDLIEALKILKSQHRKYDNGKVKLSKVVKVSVIDRKLIQKEVLRVGLKSLKFPEERIE